MSMFSPTQTGIPPRHPTEATLRPYLHQDQVGFHLNFENDHHIQGAANYFEEGESNRQSALADFVDERRSSNPHFEPRHKPSDRVQSHGLIKIGEPGKESCSFLDARSRTTGVRDASSKVSLQKSRSSSTFVVNGASSSGLHDSQRSSTGHTPASSCVETTTVKGATSQDEIRIR